MVVKWENAVKMVGAISSEGFSSQGPPLHVLPFFPLIISSLLPSLSVLMADDSTLSGGILKRTLSKQLSVPPSGKLERLRFTDETNGAL